MAVSADAIRAVVEPALTSSGFELWDVEVSGDSVRVLVDRPGGVDLDALSALAAKVVSPLLDEHPDLTPDGRFSLEVSSPGLERTLRSLDHYSRYVGTELSVKTTVPVEGARRHHGVLLSVDEDGISLAPKDGPAGAVVRLSHRQIDKARTVLVWGTPAPKPGATKRSSKRAAKRPAATGAQPQASPVASNEAKDTHR